MKAIISSTYDDQYFFFVPIVAGCWNKLGVDVRCIVPRFTGADDPKYMLLDYTTREADINITYSLFDAEPDKLATYSQCARLYACALPGIEESDYLIISDVDMAVFNNRFINFVDSPDNDIDILGHDFVPQGQFPMCYIGGRAKTFSKIFSISA